MNKETILKWMQKDHRRSILIAARHFNLEVQKVHDILNGTNAELDS